MRMNKRGSLEISINSIVVIVLAFTFLALALTFMKGFFQKGGEIATEPLDMLKIKLRDELTASGSKLSLEGTNFVVEKNSESFVVFAVGNKKDSKLNYRVEIYEVGESLPTESQGSAGGLNLPSGAGFQWDSGDQVLDVVGDASAKAEDIKYFSSSQAGSLQYKIVIWDIDADEEYSSKGFFVRVV
ncbi:hypothetical protein HY638_04195 [Candidatus Woesearchaeota archaeon]|nr:hypothetical protein [Candidatus Woesearchaeota archaeon]